MWHFENIILTLHNRNVFANTAQSFGVSWIYSYWELAWNKNAIVFLVTTSKNKKGFSIA